MVISCPRKERACNLSALPYIVHKGYGTNFRAADFINAESTYFTRGQGVYNLLKRPNFQYRMQYVLRQA